MTSVPSSRSFPWLIILLSAIILSRYIVPVRVPGPMAHPIKYKIITGTFALLLDLTNVFESITGMAPYTALNTFVDSYDRVKRRSFDHGHVSHYDRTIEDVLVRIYTPTNISNASASPVILFFHGGGLFFGSIYSHDTMNYHMSMYTGVKVIAVNYRLTPSVHYPIPIEDSLAVAQYVIDHPEEFSIDPNQVFLFGDSAGGNLALVVERRLRQEQKPPIRGVLLLYPFLQMVHFRLPSHVTYLPYDLLSLLGGDTLTQMVNFYLNTSFTSEELLNNRHLSFDDYQSFYSKVNLTLLEQDRDAFCAEHTVSAISHPETEKLFDINVSPLLADDELLLGTPPTLIVTCHYDVFLSDAQLYYQRLQKLHVKDIVYRDYRIFHGAMTFVDFPVAFPEAFEIIQDSAQFVINRTRAAT